MMADILIGVVFYIGFIMVAFDYYKKKTRRWGCNYDDDRGRKWK